METRSPCTPRRARSRARRPCAGVRRRDAPKVGGRLDGCLGSRSDPSQAAGTVKGLSAPAAKPGPRPLASVCPSPKAWSLFQNECTPGCVPGTRRRPFEDRRDLRTSSHVPSCPCHQHGLHPACVARLGEGTPRPHPHFERDSKVSRPGEACRWSPRRRRAACRAAPRRSRSRTSCSAPRTGL